MISRISIFLAVHLSFSFNTPLDYAPKPRWHRRRVARQIALLLITLGLSLVSWHWGPAIARKARSLYWQHECLIYSPSTDLVVYDQDPSGPSPLLTPGGKYAPLGRASGPRQPGNSLPTAAAFVPDCATQLLALLGLGVPTYGPTTSDLFPEAGTPNDPVVFMHQLSTPSGQKFLVILRARSADPYAPLFFLYTVTAHAIKPATWTTPASASEIPVLLKIDGFGMFKQLFQGHLRINAGQIDPADPTHFTIRYLLENKPGTIDGWLQDGSGSPCLFLKDRRDFDIHFGVDNNKALLEGETEPSTQRSISKRREKVFQFSGAPDQ